MADIGSLIIKIGADASGLQKAFSDLGGSAKQFQRGIEQIGKFAATAFLGAATAAVAMTIAAGKQAEQLDQLSQVTGINTDKLQEYDVALNRAGMDGQDLALVMKNVSTAMDQAKQGTGTAGDRFKQLGINIRTVTSTDDLIRKIVASSGNFANGIQKAAVMSDLLGRGWQTIIRTFPGGAKAFDDMAAASRALGQTLSADQIALLAKMDDSIDDLMTSTKRFGQQLGVFLAPTIEMITRLLTNMMAFGSRAFEVLGTETDVFATKLLHMGMQVQELLGTLFSENAFSGDAWKQALANVKMIGVEADKQTAKIRAAAAAARVPAANDIRAQLPAMVNTQQESARAQALLDAQLRAQEMFNQDTQAIWQSGLDNKMAILDREKAFSMKTDFEIESTRQAAIGRMDAFTISNLQKGLAEYQAFFQKKRTLFTNDEKGQAELAKFNEDAKSKELSMITKISLAQEQADTNRIRSGMQVVTFWQKQLQDIVASNVFSTAQIVTAWTGGVANSIVNGGDFVKAAWKSTELAVVQGALNMAVQWGAKQLLMLATSESVQTAITTFFGAQEAARSTIAIAGSKAAAAAAAVALGGVVAVGTATMGVLTAVLEGIVGFMLAVAAAVAEVPLIGQVLAGTLIVGATLAQVLGTAAIGAATAALTAASVAAVGAAGFAKGGIGEFGTGTPAMLHGPEAIIPLNSRGAGFMQQAFGGSSDRPIHTHVYLDGRQIALALSDHQMSALRTMGTL